MPGSGVTFSTSPLPKGSVLHTRLRTVARPVVGSHSPVSASVSVILGISSRWYCVVTRDTSPYSSTHNVDVGGPRPLRVSGARPGPATPTVMTFAQGESIDNWIARQHPANGGEPLALYAGRRDNYGEEVLSYRGPNDLRGAEDDPWAAYQRLIGTDRQRFASVNDLVLDQLQALDSSPKLAAEDRRRLDQIQHPLHYPQQDRFLRYRLDLIKRSSLRSSPTRRSYSTGF